MTQPNILQPGGRVRISSYGPFRGLRGTIRRVDHIPYQQYHEDPHRFYLIDLEGAYIKEPVWFEHDEVEQPSSN